MGHFHIRSVCEPFDRPEVGQPAVELVGLAEAMGLVPEEVELRVLDWEAVQGVVGGIARAGIATALAPRLEETHEPAELGALLRRLTAILRENPAPEFEWRRLQKVLPADELSKLVNVSVASVTRYGAGARKTPDVVAARLHFLVRIVHHLEGAYNEVGVRRWFQRPRAALGRRAPAEVLRGEWDPDAEAPLRVLELARSLNDPPAS